MNKRNDINFIMESVYGRATRSKQIRGPASAPSVFDENLNRNIKSYDVTKQPGHLLRKALQHHLAIFQRLSPEPSVTGPQFALLCVLRDLGPSSLTAIGRTAVMDPATTRGIVERLRERGLVSFSRDVNDRRQVIVAIEPAGTQILRRMIPAAIEISAATVQNLSVAEQVALRFLLEKMVTPNNEKSHTSSATPVA
jgi:MarR family transcriptional regulator, lower aerobic nicotinate degradation pathway regulator